VTGQAVTARLAAYRCLEAVEAEGAYANLAMPAILRDAGLSGREAGFATELAYGTIRLQGLYDAIIGSASGRDPARLEGSVRRVLRLGTHQILSMRVPAHAAVSETVALMREVGKPGVTGLANAVARRISEADLAVWRDRVAPGVTDADLAVRYSHPTWIVTRLRQALEADGRGDQIALLLDAHNEPAGVTLVARPGLVSRDQLLHQVADGAPTAFSPIGVAMAGGDPGSVSAVRDGRGGVQDEGSQVVALAACEAQVLTGSEHEAWHDMCAGPGGKAAILACVAAARGATLVATELHAHRAALVEQALRAVPPGSVAVRTADARADDGRYDRILLDAPCTGLGALRRRPESRWRRTETDLTDLVRLQGELLAAGLRNLKPGGVLAYVTCSPVLAETRKAIEWAAARPEGRGLEVLDARAAVASVTGTSPDAWGSGPHVQLWTHEHGTDSMFLALVRSPREIARPQ
jgi:16S rRNA (cytosine967-C5)-methyltransferase